MPRPTAAVVTGTTAISATESAELVRCLLRVVSFDLLAGGARGEPHHPPPSRPRPPPRTPPNSDQNAQPAY